MVVFIDALHGQVCRNFNDIQLVDLVKLACFGRRGSGHAGQLWIHAEVILKGNRRECLVLRLDLHAFLCFHSLMQTIGPAASVHHASGKLIDDDDLVFLDDVINVALEHDIGFQRLVQMVHDQRVLIIIQIGTGQQACGLEQPFCLFRPVFGQGNIAALLVLFIIAVVQLQDDRMHLHIKFGFVVSRP